jgi:hypothetical protein
MPDQQQETTDIKTRANLAYVWSIAAILFIGFILVRWGDQKEILTLIIGLIGGTVLGGVFGVYFGGTSVPGKKPDNIVQQTGDSPVTNLTPPNQ